MERVDRYGEGMLRARSRTIGLLYRNGYARRPSEVRRLVPELIADYRNRWRELREQLRQWRSGDSSEADAVIRRSGVAAAVATIREATRVALVLAAIGLMCVGLALVLREHPLEKVGLRVTVEYYAALLFFLAVSITHNGVWGERQHRMLVPRDDWLRRSLKETARAFGVAISVRLAPEHHRPLVLADGAVERERKTQGPGAARSRRRGAGSLPSLGTKLHAEFVRLLPTPPQPVSIRHWSLRRVGLMGLTAVALVLLALAVVSFGANEAPNRTSLQITSLPCDDLEPLWLHRGHRPAQRATPAS
jgi:hypothetical protein